MYDIPKEAKTVAIIGAGPAGLTTAKAMLERGLRPVVFERKKGVGGLWACSDINGDVDADSELTAPPTMTTNGSRWLTEFSDFAWRGEFTSGGTESSPIPTFPRAQDVNRYLKAYAAQYIVPGTLRLSTEVVKVGLINDANSSLGKRWCVEWRNSSGALSGSSSNESEIFDHLAITCGFFSTPHIPDLPGLDKFKQDGGEVRHSADYHKHAGNPSAFFEGDGKTVVVGGSLSAVEVVSDILLNNAAGRNGRFVHLFPRPFWVMPRYVRVPKAPNMNQERGRSGPCRLPWLPLDFVTYDAARRRRLKASALDTTATPEDRFQTQNAFLSSLAGNGDQSCLSPALCIDEAAMRLPPYIGSTDSYAGFVRAGSVSLQRGNLGAVVRGSSGKWDTVEVWDPFLAGADEPPPKITTIAGVKRLIFATGYGPSKSLPSFLPLEILDAIEFVPTNVFLPVLLYKQMLHPFLITYPSQASLSANGRAQVHAGFVGMYKGPYWGIMEAQAKYLAGLFTGDLGVPSKEEVEKGVEEMRAFRIRRQGGKEVERLQWSMGDYLETMDELEELIQRGNARDSKRGLDRALERTSDKVDVGVAPAVPAHFDTAASGELNVRANERKQILSSLYAFLDVATESANPRTANTFPGPLQIIPFAVFRSLQGPWNVFRTLTSTHPSSPSGTFQGTASWIPRPPTFTITTTSPEDGDSFEPDFHPTPVANPITPTFPHELLGYQERVTEYLYTETGTFTITSTPTPLSFPATRQYIWRLSTETASVSVWFVKPSTNANASVEDSVVDYLFHELDFVPPDTEEGEWPSWAGVERNRNHVEYRAVGRMHLCVKDLYQPRYRFCFKEAGGAEIEEMGIGYEVSGPKKGYVGWGVYRRG